MNWIAIPVAIIVVLLLLVVYIKFNTHFDIILGIFAFVLIFGTLFSLYLYVDNRIDNGTQITTELEIVEKSMK